MKSPFLLEVPLILRKVFWNHYCPDFSHCQLIDQTLMNSSVNQIQLFPDHSDCQPTIRRHFYRFLNMKAVVIRFIFNRFSSFWTFDKTVSIHLAKFCKSFRCTVLKSKAKHDNILFDIAVIHFQNALEKTVSQPKSLWIPMTLASYNSY